MTASARESMPEAEVALRLAFWFLDSTENEAHVDIAIDGAHVRVRQHEAAGTLVKERVIFDIKSYLQNEQCYSKNLTGDWQGEYKRKNCTFTIRSIQGFDVSFQADGRTIKAECKGLRSAKGTSESTILAHGIGQVIASGSTAPNDELWVAVPDFPAFKRAGARILKSEIFLKTGIRIALVNRNGNVKLLGA
jgi:hypothetical protein